MSRVTKAVAVVSGFAVVGLAIFFTQSAMPLWGLILIAVVLEKCDSPDTCACGSDNDEGE